MAIPDAPAPEKTTRTSLSFFFTTRSALRTLGEFPLPLMAKGGVGERGGCLRAHRAEGNRHDEKKCHSYFAQFVPPVIQIPFVPLVSTPSRKGR